MAKSDRAEFTTRVLMSLVNDMNELNTSAERLRVQIEALAAEYGVKVPDPVE